MDKKTLIRMIEELTKVLQLEIEFLENRKKEYPNQTGWIVFFDNEIEMRKNTFKKGINSFEKQLNSI